MKNVASNVANTERLRAKCATTTLHRLLIKIVDAIKFDLQLDATFKQCSFR